MVDFTLPINVERPKEEAILNRWNTFINNPLLSLESLKRQAVDGKLLENGLRSLSWRYFFSLLPSPSSLADTSSTSTSHHSTYSLLLSHQRTEYDDLRERYLRTPDGGYIEDGDANDDELVSKQGTEDNRDGRSTNGKGKPVKVDAKVNNPLGLEQDNPWQSWFADLELRKTIRQDVQRTFPEIDYFRRIATQNRMTDLLFIYTKLTPDVGYRQGMHELLAPILWTVDFDSIPWKDNRRETSRLPHLVLSRQYLEHDTWSLFSALMKSTSPFYDHNATIPIPRPVPQPRVQGLGLAPANPPSSASTLVQPIVAIASHLHSLLLTLDPQLHTTFTRLQIEPQLYAIRWLRLLFSREFPLSETLILWDGLFARDPSLQLTQHIALAMLLRIRDSLIAAEREGGYGDFLQVLLRYPACPDGTFRTPLLLAQAVYLRDNLSFEGAEHIRGVNERLGLTNHVHEASDEWVDLRSAAARGAHGQKRGSVVSAANGGGGGPLVGVGLLGEGGLGDLAKGVYGRAEALGINKAIFGTFNDIRRGVTAAQAQLEEQRQRQRGSFSQIPSRPPWEPTGNSPASTSTPAVKDALSDLAKMRSSSIAMSSALDLCVSVLEKAITPPTPLPPSNGKFDAPTSEETRTTSSTELGRATSTTPSLAPQVMAITALKHIRDVLGGQANTFDSSVLQPLQQTLDLLNKSPPLPPLPFDSPTLSSHSSTTSQTSPNGKGPPLASTSTSTKPPNPTPHPRVPSPSPPPTPTATTPSLYLSSRSEKPLPSLTRTLPQSPKDPLSTSTSSNSSSFSSGRPSPLLTTYSNPSPAPSTPRIATPTSERSPRADQPSKYPPSPSVPPPPTFDPLGVL